MTEYKKCSLCDRTLPKTTVYFCKKTPKYFQSWCKDCVARCERTGGRIARDKLYAKILADYRKEKHAR